MKFVTETKGRSLEEIESDLQDATGIGDRHSRTSHATDAVSAGLQLRRAAQETTAGWSNGSSDMDELQAQRRLVKSPPELWAEVSDEDVLRHHLAPFGAIRITRREPETTVAWEGERASGTVSLDAAGWGTRVTLTAVPVAPAEGEPWVDPRRWVAPEEEAWAPEPPTEEEPEPVAEEPEPEPEPEPVAEEPDPEPARRGLLRAAVPPAAEGGDHR